MTCETAARRLRDLTRSGTDAVLVTVVRTEGSTPRDAGSRMIVTGEGSSGTIGGGALEYLAAENAAEMLRRRERQADLHEFTLGPKLGQCCGGVALVLFELVKADSPPAWIDEILTRDVPSQSAAIATVFSRPESMSHKTVELISATEVPFLTESEGGIVFVEPVAARQLNVVVFGAGHVGTALVGVLSGCDCSITWVDSRSDLFPESSPANVRTIVVDEDYREAVALIDGVPEHSYFIVLTHSHALDFLLCEAILRSGRFRYVGLIGSATKRETFKHRWCESGIPDEVIDRLTCPIGLSGIPGKSPGDIAVAVAAQLLQLEATDATEPDRFRSNVAATEGNRI